MSTEQAQHLIQRYTVVEDAGIYLPLVLFLIGVRYVTVAIAPSTIQ